MNASVIQVPESVISLRVFGSYCRGDNDKWSDVDVLAVHRDKPDEKSRQSLRVALDSAFGRSVDLAEYSPTRLRQIFSSGHLFAWHLRTESANLRGEPDEFFESLGEPAPYPNAARDAQRFLKLLRTVPTELGKVGVSTVYESGLLYLGSRNVGLCTSWELYRAPNFSRHAILAVTRQLGLELGLSECDYSRLIDCRFGTVRGYEIDPPSEEWVRITADALVTCCTEVCKRAFGDFCDEQ